MNSHSKEQNKPSPMNLQRRYAFVLTRTIKRLLEKDNRGGLLVTNLRKELIADQDSMPDNNVRLKLLIDKQKQRVLFAEGGKDFVDFLFTILTLPLGTVVKLLTKSSMVGSLGKLYESVENLNQSYMQPSQTKDTLLRPKTSPIHPKSPLLQSDSNECLAFTFYKCSEYSTQYVSAVCPIRKDFMTERVKYLAPPTGTASDYVKETVTFMIMDDLQVKPMSTISGITLLMDIAAVEEKVVDIGMHKALDILKASLQSNTVLTDVFIRLKMKALD